MRNLKRALAAVFVLLLAAVVLFFVLENQQTVSLVLFGWLHPPCRLLSWCWLPWSLVWQSGRCWGPTGCSAASARSGLLPVRRH